jgi:hypothetical protein
VKWHYYDGNSPGPCLILPPANENAAVADLLVVPDNGDPPYSVRDVPRRDKGSAEGTGHTFREAK